MNNTSYIVLHCVDNPAIVNGMCQNVTALKMALVPHQSLFWQWVRMWF